MWVYMFNDGSSKMRNLLGGKGAEIAEMTNLGLPVPPGFTITTEACIEFFTKGEKFPAGLQEEVLEKLKVLEEKTRRRFGDKTNPLLVSVRSGAPVSMPGMMDTILNLGLNDETVAGFAAQSGDERFAWDCYRRLIQTFSRIVLGVEGTTFERILEDKKKEQGVKEDFRLSPQALREIVSEYKQLAEKTTGNQFPQNPVDQLFMAIGAVFRSWNSKRAIEYRRIYKISNDLGTAVNVQAMVFGNRGADSGTGVVFTRDPSTGERMLYGEFLANAQGEDVVAGIRTPTPIIELQKENPQLYAQLDEVAKLLEKHYKEMQDIEFTVEEGKLYILQTRTGKRSPQAAVRIAVDMAKTGIITVEEALVRVPAAELSHLLHRQVDPNAKVSIIARGLPASPGAASGIVIFDVDEASKRGNAGEKIILVRPETSPEDIHGIVAAQGVLTNRGGMTCHAAVVARGMGKPAVVGCEELRINLENKYFLTGAAKVKEGDMITLDGGSGAVLMGEVPTIQPEISGELRDFLQWADTVRTLKVRANADTPQGAARAREFGAEGIGLCRTERMFNARDRLPIVQEMILARTSEERRNALEKLRPMQKSDFKQIFHAMQGLPVTVRLLDLPLHEFLPRLEDTLVEVTELKTKGEHSDDLARKERILRRTLELQEHNPMLGHRGCRLAVTYPEIYMMQTQAIFEAATELEKEGVKFNLEIMLPLVSNAKELSYLRPLIEDTAAKVMKDAGVEIDYLIGTMMEIPRAALTAAEIAEYADFFSFGTNDLTQTTFGFSRDDAEGKFIHEYFEKKILDANPFEILDRGGIGKLMTIAVSEGRAAKKDLKVGICGEHGGEPSSIEFCHQLNLDYVSCSPFRVPIARLAAAQAKLRPTMAASEE